MALGVAVGLALAAHGWLLAWAPRAPTGVDPTRPAQVQVRHIVLPGAGFKTQEAATAAPATLASQLAALRAQPQDAAPHRVQAEPAVARNAVQTRPALRAEPAAPPGPAAAPGGTPLPVYTTRLPPAATLQYQLRRGALAGQATLQWQPAGTGYQIHLQGQALGKPLVEWASQGEFDDAGIAPVRYSESRRGRELRAANFERGAGRISYSGPAVEHALVPGAQDRLSWLFQLGAVLAANPGLAAADAEVAMWVVGSRGDAQTWTFTVLGMEAVDLPDGSAVPALHLHRAPTRPYDTHADVWLDPARHHLPVRLHLRVHATGEGTQYLLERLDLP